MAIRIAIVSQKGGVGKTTVALNLAVALAEGQRRTTLVDLDPQGAIGLSLARQNTEWAGLTELLMGQRTVAESLIQTKLPALAILPRGRLDPGDVAQFEQVLFAPGTLDAILQQLENGNDYILIDVPSGLGLLPRAALAASDFALVPFQAETLALRSVAQVLQLIEHVRGRENPRLKLLGILPTMVRLGKDSSMEVMSAVWGNLGGVLETVVPWSEVYARASKVGLPVAFLGGVVSPEARRFEMLAGELESRIAQLGGKVGEGYERPQRELL